MDQQHGLVLDLNLRINILVYKNVKKLLKKLQEIKMDLNMYKPHVIL